MPLRPKLKETDMTTYGLEHKARAGLSRVVEPSHRLPDEIHALSAVEQWEILRGGQRAGLEPLWGKANAANPAEDLERAARFDTRFLIPGDPDWPEQLDLLREFDGGAGGSTYRSIGVPYGLWVRGRTDLRDLAKKSISLIGSRACTQYGEHVASELSAGLVRQGYVVIAGGAYGIDAGAHRGALAESSTGVGSTVAVLSCGVDVAYPKRNESLFGAIVDRGGLVVSEMPPGCTPTRTRFLMRNRIVAALALGTVVVEASIRSGSMNTVGWAERLEHPVMAVPGPISSMQSAAPHELIRTGRACLVTSVDEILEVCAKANPVRRCPACGRGLRTPVWTTKTGTHEPEGWEIRAECGCQ